MDDLISRQAAIDAVHYEWDLCLNFDGSGTEIANDTEKALCNVPSADIDLSGFSDKLWRSAYERGKAEAERHGHWIYTPTNLLGYACSECGKAMCRFNYCPHCGARMDGE